MLPFWRARRRPYTQGSTAMATRRTFLAGALASTIAPEFTVRAQPQRGIIGVHWIDHSPVRWVQPARHRSGVNAVIWLNHLGGGMDALDRQLTELAEAGYIAISFDTWQHGRRATETEDQILARVFGNFRQHMWPILGQSALEATRVIDWVQASFPIPNQVHIGGISMGGDIAVAVAGLDPRVRSVAAIVATPDWLRPGMRDLFEPSQLLDPGMADPYATFFYDTLNPLTHLERYDREVAISFECAADDTHVPPQGALQFQTALDEREAAAEVRVQLHPNRTHRQLRDPVFWSQSLAWFDRHSDLRA